MSNNVVSCFFSRIDQDIEVAVLPVKREEDFAVLWPFFWVRKQVDEKRDITRCPPFQLLEHFQEDRSSRFLKNYVPKPDPLLKKFAVLPAPTAATPSSRSYKVTEAVRAFRKVYLKQIHSVIDHLRSQPA
jgi:hypothetical protein